MASVVPATGALLWLKQTQNLLPLCELVSLCSESANRHKYTRWFPRTEHLWNNRTKGEVNLCLGEKVLEIVWPRKTFGKWTLEWPTWRIEASHTSETLLDEVGRRPGSACWETDSWTCGCLNFLVSKVGESSAYSNEYWRALKNT